MCWKGNSYGLGSSPTYSLPMKKDTDLFMSPLGLSLCLLLFSEIANLLSAFVFRHACKKTLGFAHGSDPPRSLAQPLFHSIRLFSLGKS